MQAAQQQLIDDADQQHHDGGPAGQQRTDPISSPGCNYAEQAGDEQVGEDGEKAQHRPERRCDRSRFVQAGVHLRHNAEPRGPRDQCGKQAWTRGSGRHPCRYGEPRT
jgi:hypothetical protein